MPKPSSSLTPLLGLLSRLDDASAIVELVAAELSRHSPRAVGFCALYKGRPALEMAHVAAAQGGAPSSLNHGMRTAFATSATLFDRWTAEYRERNRWRRKSLSMVPGSTLAAYWGSQQLEFNRIVVCDGEYPIGYMSVGFNDGSPAPAMTSAFRQRAKGLADILRVAAFRSRQRGPLHTRGEKWLKGYDGAAVFAANGELLASTPSVRRLARSGELGDGQNATQSAHHRAKPETVDGADGLPFHIVKVTLLRTEPPAVNTHAPYGALTRREQDVVNALLEGGRNKDIADRLGVRASTVKSALEKIYQKTGVTSRAQLVKWSLNARAKQH